jgi:hypothetical protein
MLHKDKKDDILEKVLRYLSQVLQRFEDAYQRRIKE